MKLLRLKPIIPALLTMIFAAPVPAEHAVTADNRTTPVLRAGEVTSASPHHDVKLYFPWALGVDEATIGDGDLVTRGPAGYPERATLVSLERLPLPLIEPAVSPATGLMANEPLPQPHPILVATYRFLPPGDGWSAADNGTYGVTLAGEEIANEQGRFLPRTFLGAFEVRIHPPGPGTSLQPEAVRCQIERRAVPTNTDAGDRNHYFAAVTMSFASPRVKIDWGNVELEGRTFTVEARAFGAPSPVSDEVVLDSVDGVGAELLGPRFAHRYRLGPLDSGAWKFVLKVNGIEECTESTMIPTDPPVDDEAPEADLVARDVVTANARPQQLLVTYRDRSGVDPSTIGEGDLVVFSPCAFRDVPDPVACGWQAKRARFVELVSVSDHAHQIKARYEIDAPDGGWTAAHNGYYPVALWDEAVCDRLGNCTPRQRLGGFEVRIDPSEPPIAAEAEIRVDVGNPDRVAAKVHVKFREHYKVVAQDIRRSGGRIYLEAKAEPLFYPAIYPPPPPPRQELNYEIGPLEAGTYAAIYVMNGHVYEVERFRVNDSGFEAKVGLTVDIGDEIVVKAVVDIDDPNVIVTHAGIPSVEGNRIRIDATAERVNFIQEPSGEPMTFGYDLGTLRPGGYELIYLINGQPEARAVFRMPVPCDPLPHVARIKIAQGDVAWYSEVFVALFPGQRVTDWGTVRRDGNGFHVDVQVECVDFAPPPVPPVVRADDVDLPEGMAIDDAGTATMRGVPVRLVSNTYVLGDPVPGRYKFFVHSRGTTVARQGFVVGGTAPEVELSVEAVTAQADEHRFGINFHDPDGLGHDSIMNAEVVVSGRDGYRETARLLSYASTDDVPSTGASARYAVSGPGGSWDESDNGGYRVWIDPTAVVDLQGTALEDGHLGGFRVRIAPPSSPGVNVEVAPSADGSWQATVEIIPEAGEQVVVDSWGPVIHHGLTFVALASVHLKPADGPVEPLSHTYDLGPLPPGTYWFVFKTDLGHCGIADFTVPGVGGDPVDVWARLAGVGEADDDAALLGYYFALDPRWGDLPQVRPELVAGDDCRHLALRVRRLRGGEGVRQVIEGSSDLTTWQNVSGRIEVRERQVGTDGTEEVLLCLRDALDDTPVKYLRLRLVRDDP